MKVFKVTYKLFNWPYYKAEISSANVRANDENHAIEILKKELKNNGHRLNKIIGVEVNDNPNGIMVDIQNAKE